MKGWRKESARHSLAARGINTVPSKSVSTAITMVRNKEKNVPVPPRLYHGTPTSNLSKILDEGLRIGVASNSFTLETGHAVDCWSNISLSNKVQDACFFAAAANMGKGVSGGSQAIIEVDMTKLPDNPCVRRLLFGKKDHYEYKFYTRQNIPPSAITRIMIREMKPFSETWYTPEEWRSKR